MSFELGAPDAGGIDGTEPLGMTAKNGAPGGSFCVGGKWQGTAQNKATRGFMGLSAGCWRVSGSCHVGVGVEMGVFGWLQGVAGRVWWPLMGDVVPCWAGVKWGVK